MRVPPPQADRGPSLIQASTGLRDRAWLASRNPQAADMGLNYRLIPINAQTLMTLPRSLWEQRANGPQSGGPKAYSYPSPTVPGPYKLGAGDELEIQVANPLAGTKLAAGTESANGQIITSRDNQGRISAPLAGSVKVQGLTLSEARKKIRSAVSGYIKSPDVFVRITKYGSQSYSVGGGVRSPGIFALGNRQLSLTSALQQAGGLAIKNPKQTSVILIRGKDRYEMPATLVAKGQLPKRITIEHGDELVVQEDLSPDTSRPRFLYVGGEVISPQRIALSHKLSRPMTLADVLFEAKGWIKESADPRHVYVIREGRPGLDCPSKAQYFPGYFPGYFAGGRPYMSPQAGNLGRMCALIFQLNIEHAANFVLATHFPLAENDFVFVATKPIAHWNQTLGSLLPTLQGVSTLKSLVP